MSRIVFFAPAAGLALLACGDAGGSSGASARAPAAEQAAASAKAAAGSGAAATADSARDAAVADPAAFVRGTYDRYLAGGDVPTAAEPYSPELRALVERDRREAANEVGRLDFDFWVNGQDWQIDKVDVREEAAGEGRRVVVARFRNGDAPTVNRFTFVPGRGGWLLDDVENVGGPPETRWRLKQILSEPLA